MINEHDLVVLTGDMPDEGLRAGDVGTVVHAYLDKSAFEVEFSTLTGSTISVTTVEATNVRPAAASDVYHVRPLAATG